MPTQHSAPSPGAVTNSTGKNDTTATTRSVPSEGTASARGGNGPAGKVTFDLFDLDPRLAHAVAEMGYRDATPIQAEAIPPLLAGHDVIGQAQTGTGKTAAFALPLISRLEKGQRDVQMLVLTPTRELAIQVAEAIEGFTAEAREVRTLAVYGGADIRGQLTGLKRRPQIVVGTPGRVMDHMRRGTLELGSLAALVLDEADEMLRMGFLEDVEWILERAPENCQKALFSATMQPQIRTIAKRHMSRAVEVTVEARTTTAATIEQRYWEVRGMHRLDALSRILEAEERTGVLVFTRTRAASTKLAQALEGRGFSAEALNGDMAQAKREQTVERLRQGRTEVLVATDVAARGLDVDRISHVINYDLPHDAEAYTHRIGRTGRAGRSGLAILFINPRDRRMMRTIEQTTRQRLEPYIVPTPEQVRRKQMERLKQRIGAALQGSGLDLFREAMKQLGRDTGADALDLAAAAASLMSDGDAAGRPVAQTVPNEVKRSAPTPRSAEPSTPEPERRRERKRARETAEQGNDWIDAQMEQFRVEVGYEDGVQPGNIVGAIANESGLESRYIGRIEINDSHSTVDLPRGMPREVMKHLRGVWVCGKQLQIRRTDAGGSRPSGKGKGAPAKGPRRSRPERTPAAG